MKKCINTTLIFCFQTIARIFQQITNRYTPSTLDFFLTNSPPKLGLIKTINSLPSDHLPVQCTISNEGLADKNHIYKFSKANWNRYRSIITRNMEAINLNSVEEIVQMVSNFEEEIKAAIEISVPKVQFSTKCTDKLPEFIINLIKDEFG